MREDTAAYVAKVVIYGRNFYNNGKSYKVVLGNLCPYLFYKISYLISLHTTCSGHRNLTCKSVIYNCVFLITTATGQSYRTVLCVMFA
jgi:hypothetical protein